MTSITKAEFDTLPDSLKTKFKSEGESYILLEEDVEGLKKSKAEILAEKKAIQSELEELKKFKSEFESSKSAEEEEKLRQAGEFKKLEEKLRAKITELETNFGQEKQSLLNSFKTERLTNELIKRGVMADRAKYALADIIEQVDLVTGDTGFSLKVKNGIGDAKEFDSLIEGMKQSSPFFFAPSNGTGSGASGSSSNTNGGNAKTLKRDAFFALSPVEQMAFSTSGGKLEE